MHTQIVPAGCGNAGHMGPVTKKAPIIPVVHGIHPAVIRLVRRENIGQKPDILFRTEFRRHKVDRIIADADCDAFAGVTLCIGRRRVDDIQSGTFEILRCFKVRRVCRPGMGKHAEAKPQHNGSGKDCFFLFRKGSFHGNYPLQQNSIEVFSFRRLPVFYNYNKTAVEVPRLLHNLLW